LICGRARFRWERADLGVLSGAAVFWVLYAVHVLFAWEHFVTDMWSQLRFKALVSIAGGGILKRVTERPFLFALVLLVGAQYHARKLRVPVGALSALSAAFLVQMLTAAGWLYEVYAGIAALIASVVALEVATTWALERWKGRGAWVGWALAGLVVAANAKIVVRSEYVNRSLERATVTRPTLDPPYMQDVDRDAVRRYLRSITPKVGKVVVQFVPDADALLFEDLRGPHLAFVMQTFFEHSFDVVIAHESVWYPKWIREIQLLKMFIMQGREPTKVDALVQRDNAERWVAFEWFGLPRMVPPVPSGLAEGR
jgi:hypothetical protein